MATKQEFAKFMAALTRAIPRFAPNIQDELLLDAWYAEVGQLPSAELGDVYQAAVRTFDQFPSLRELLGLAGKAEPSDEDKGREVAERLLVAATKFGRLDSPMLLNDLSEDETMEDGGKRQRERRWREICDYIGPIGVEVVKLQPSWDALCRAVDKDRSTTLKAQWRELAITLARKHRSGAIEAPPAFAALPQRKQLTVVSGAGLAD